MGLLYITCSLINLMFFKCVRSVAYSALCMVVVFLFVVGYFIHSIQSCY
jgi:hypothetical protein